MHYDITLKDLLTEPPIQLFQLLLGSTQVQMLPVEFSKTKQRRPDVILQSANGELHHLELQSDNDEDMEWRQLEYYSLIYRRYQRVPIQQVLYVGHAAMQLVTHINHEHLQFSYQAVDIRQVDCLPLLTSTALSDNILSLLGKLPNKREALRRVLHRVAKLDENQRQDVLTKLAILAGLRPLELPLLLKEEVQQMSIRVNLLENPLFRAEYERGLQASRLEGRLAGLLEGQKEGQLQGRENSMRDIARLMQQEGMAPELIQKLTGLSLEDLQQLH